MVVSVNSKPRELPADATVGVLLEALAVGEKRVAVEVNAELVTKAQWKGFKLKEGDRVEIVTFVGGG